MSSTSANFLSCKNCYIFSYAFRATKNTTQLRIPVYVPKKRTEFYIQYKTPTYRFACGNYKPSGYTSRKRKKKYFATSWLAMCRVEFANNGRRFHIIGLSIFSTPERK